MKIQFPINNDCDCQVFYAIMEPELFCIQYASAEAKEKYFSLTEQEKQEIKNFVKEKHI